MSSYPVLEIVPKLLECLQHHPITLLEAPPGAGKSTVLPLEFLKLSFLENKKIILLEPRRLAARMVAERLAFLLGENVGETIGYRIRFEKKISEKTKIEVVTEGILTSMLQQDNALEQVGLIVFDEFHERNLQADLSLALCREVQECLRDDLKILIMSATMNISEFSDKLRQAPMVRSLGKQFQIEISYYPSPENTALPLQVGNVMGKALKEKGDVLVFLPGSADILRTASFLEEKFPHVIVFPLYGDLSIEKQQQALLPIPSKQKIILSTSIAETSLTIEGVTVVIDSGLGKTLCFDSRSGMSKLETTKISIDAANQRAGRAGRLGPGKCFRLWEEKKTLFLEPHRKPEIEDADLIPVMLELARWGNVHSTYWITPPNEGNKLKALSVLQTFGALTDDFQITSYGKKLASIPLHPRLGHLMLEAETQNLLPLATDVCAILEEKDVLYGHSSTDIGIRIEELRKWRESRQKSNYNFTRVEKLAQQFRSVFKLKEDNSVFDVYQVRKLLAKAFPERIAQKKENTIYRLSNGRMAKLPDFDWLEKESFIAIAQIDAGEKIGKVFLSAPLAKEDLEVYAVEKERVFWDSDKEMIQAALELQYAGLVLQSKWIDANTSKNKNLVLIDLLQKQGLKYLNFTEQVLQLQARVCSLRKWNNEDQWPDFSSTYLLKNIGEWLSPYLDQVKTKLDLSKLDLYQILKSSLAWDLQQQLDELAPESITVPSGSNIKIQYFEDGQLPVLAVRLQEMFGLLETPTVNKGQQVLLLHLLSPGYKPVQVTQDLKSFWKNTYPEVRKELRVRYSKHFWPEDPWTAEAVRGVKRKS